MESREITKLNCNQARDFFMEEKNYINFDIPDYFHFSELLKKVYSLIKDKELVNICNKKIKDGKTMVDWPKYYENVNYLFLDNKDGAYAWRPLQLIHPVLYIDLVNTMTAENNWNQIIKRFDFFSKGVVECISIPRVSNDDNSHKSHQVKYWWDKIEQASIKMTLEYDYMFATDITNCYGSIYTHSVDWSLCDGGRSEAKKNKYEGVKNTIGAIIDKKIEGMNYGQTNGIPQGSILMDFIAEIVLGYADMELTNLLKNDQRMNEQNYKILRYRDDYRVFVKDPLIGKEILKHLNQVLSDFGMKMNPCKTSENDDVILSSIKKEKLERIFIAPNAQNYQKEALRIYQLSKKHPNSGLLSTELNIYYDRIENLKSIKNSNIEVLISIFVMIAFTSPKSINWISAILSLFLEMINDENWRKEIIKKIHEKFKTIPNSSLIDVWLQRISAPLGVEIEYSDNLTKVAMNQIDNLRIWESKWLIQEISDVIKVKKISNLDDDLKNKKLSRTIPRAEVQLFRLNYND